MPGGYSSITPPPPNASRCRRRCRRNCRNSPTMPQPRPRQYDLIAFDWDGTLFDSTQIIVRCIQQAVADVGGAIPSERDAAYVIGMGLMEALAHAAPDVPRER